MIVTFFFDVPEQVDEDSLRSDFGHWQPLLLDDEAVYGGIIIRPEIGPDVTVEDELWNIVRALCFEAVVELMAGRQVTYTYLAADQYVVLIPAETLVRILGDDIEPASVYREELATALFRCGERYLELVDRLKDASATYRQLADLLQPLRDKAAQALEGP